MKQVRYWGKEKIDPDILAMGSTTDMNKTGMNLISQKIPINSALKKLRSDLQHTNKRDVAKIQDIKEKAAELIEERKTIDKKLKKVNDKLGIINVPKLPEIETVDDSSIAARYEAVMQDRENMKKRKPSKLPKTGIIDMMKEYEKKKKRKPAKKTKRNIQMDLTEEDIKLGVDEMIADIRRLVPDLKPSEIKNLKKQFEAAKKKLSSG